MSRFEVPDLGEAQANLEGPEQLMPSRTMSRADTRTVAEAQAFLPTRTTRRPISRSSSHLTSAAPSVQTTAPSSPTIMQSTFVTPPARLTSPTPEHMHPVSIDLGRKRWRGKKITASEYVLTSAHDMNVDPLIANWMTNIVNTLVAKEIQKSYKDITETVKEQFGSITNDIRILDENMRTLEDNLREKDNILDDLRALTTQMKLDLDLTSNNNKATYQEMDERTGKIHGFLNQVTTMLNSATSMAGTADRSVKKLEGDLLTIRTQVNSIRHTSATTNAASISSAPVFNQATTTSSVPLQAPIPLPAYPSASILTAPAGSISTTGLSAGLSHAAKSLAPPKFSGNTDQVKYDDWVNGLVLWLRASGAQADADKVIMSMGVIEGKAREQMRDYWTNLEAFGIVPSWATFLARMNGLFRGILPEQAARAKLDEVCEKYSKNFAKFAEEFPVPATDSRFSDQELIHRITGAIDGSTRNTIVSVRIADQNRVPTTWREYLQFALEIFKETRNKPSTSTTVHAVSTTAPTDRKPLEKKDLTAEQVEWVKRGDCACCGKHPYKFRQRCPEKNPKYRGPFNMPQRERKKTVKTMDEDDNSTGPSTDAAVMTANTINPETLAQFEAWRNAQATTTNADDAKDFASVV